MTRRRRAASKAGLVLCALQAACAVNAPSPADDLLECFGLRRGIAHSLLAGKSGSLAGERVGLVDIRVRRAHSSTVVGHAVCACEVLGIAAGDGIQLECNDKLAALEGKGPLGHAGWRPGELRRCVVVRYDMIPGIYYRFWVILSADPSQ